jgi:hypothetical protein
MEEQVVKKLAVAIFLDSHHHDASILTRFGSMEVGG